MEFIQSFFVLARKRWVGWRAGECLSDTYYQKGQTCLKSVHLNVSIKLHLLFFFKVISDDVYQAKSLKIALLWFTLHNKQQSLAKE